MKTGTDSMEIDNKPGEEETNHFDENFSKASGRKKKKNYVPNNPQENELLANLTEKFGLYKLTKSSPNKTAVWIEITHVFNNITGHDFDHKTLSKRWYNR